MEKNDGNVSSPTYLKRVSLCERERERERWREWIKRGRT